MLVATGVLAGGIAYNSVFNPATDVNEPSPAKEQEFSAAVLSGPEKIDVNQTRTYSLKISRNENFSYTGPITGTHLVVRGETYLCPREPRNFQIGTLGKNETATKQIEVRGLKEGFYTLTVRVNATSENSDKTFEMMDAFEIKVGTPENSTDQSVPAAEEGSLPPC